MRFATLRSAVAVTCRQLGNKRYFSRRVSRRRNDDEDDFEEREPRKLSAFNLYMQKMLPVMKQQHPELNHKEVFKMCAQSWKTARENPKNTRTPR
ncbi:hypothetical protein Gasu2_21340 [Galdieria sulphuraria]|uniref:HMG box domain-containing protein n=1 Tax=Galdieria sulphuraria TaxID=130081 RepID=M2WV96_GALSU|nr:uncharacterized protein Gasu_45490 [Galdieria sulphuraria]EME27885.1 hypothetical protein Gasu_45490 [Galdieria sulphuraria]GJD07796.1 hypothetical protein Gasu2_21340 [Galdieria sulphuraria]|eukprot:XP_005704405.1 hypothetical protein Gasu_45490 [Galdieria sulphuraria]